jgi:2-methylcitrate dehydratase PrpD
MSGSGMTITGQLARILARPVGEAERRRAALHLLDWAGCVLAGRREAAGAAMERLAGHPLARAGTGDVGLSGGFGSLLEMDDVHRAALLHPGPAVCPVVMTVPGPDPLAALVRGYEAMIRLGAAVGPGHYAFFHNSSTCGGMGAAAAAAGLIGLSERETVWAMGHAMSLAGGLWQCRHEPVATKHLHMAEAARRGVAAARWAEAALAGPESILEGVQGFFAAVARDGDCAAVVADGDGPWRVHEVSFKPWPACRHAHPAIDAALALRGRIAGEPVAVTVETYGDAVKFCDRAGPCTAGEARFSLQHAVAVTLRDGAPPIAAFEAGALAGYADLRGRVTVARDAGFDAAYPAHFGARVTVQTGAGTWSETVTDAWGDAENPMGEADMVAKFRRLAAWGGVPEGRTEALERAVLALPDGAPMAETWAAMRSIAAETETAA